MANTLRSLSNLVGAVALGAATLLTSPPAGTQDAPGAEAGPGERREEPERSNELALVLAGTHEHEEEASFFTIGGEYERRLGRRWGVGVTAEYVTDIEAFVMVTTVVFRPLPRLKLLAGPGIESKCMVRRSE